MALKQPQDPQKKIKEVEELLSKTRFVKTNSYQQVVNRLKIMSGMNSVETLYTWMNAHFEGFDILQKKRKKYVVLDNFKRKE